MYLLEQASILSPTQGKYCKGVTDSVTIQSDWGELSGFVIMSTFFSFLCYSEARISLRRVNCWSSTASFHAWHAKAYNSSFLLSLLSWSLKAAAQSCFWMSWWMQGNSYRINLIVNRIVNNYVSPPIALQLSLWERRKACLKLNRGQGMCFNVALVPGSHMVNSIAVETAAIFPNIISLQLNADIGRRN